MAAPESEAAVTPASPAPIFEALESASMVQEARWYCYSRRSGRFLHWGRCGRPRAYRPRHHYRYYCVSRATGRFLHWGRC